MVAEHHPPLDDQHLSEFLTRTDQRLRSTGCPIPARPMRAILEMAREYRLPLPLAPIPEYAEHPSSSYWAISKQVFDWFEDRYQDKLKVDVTLGTTVVDLDGDLWTVRLPLLLGTGTFVVVQLGVELPTGMYNILHLVEGLTETHARSLSQNALADLHDAFQFAFFALAALEGSKGNRLLDAARADIAATVLHLTSPRPQYGAARWASLQVAEKTMKAAIELAGHTFSRTHDLKTLEARLQRCGIRADIGALLPQLQCAAKVRYGEERSSGAQALAAHRASINVIVELYRAGAAFRSILRSAG